MALAPVSSATPSSNAAFGLDFQSLLQIILTQLTYQDPLKPLDNFQFVSQLGQFAQLQQSQTLNDQMTNLLAAQATTQATTLLGRTVDVNAGASPITGVVKAVSFANRVPQITVQTSDGSTIANIAISSITQVR